MKWYDRLATATWIDDSSGRKTPVGDMTPQEARNALTIIDRHDLGIVVAAAKALEGRLTADAEEAAMMDDPRAWLASTPLVQALTEQATACIGPRPSRPTAPEASRGGVARTISASSDTLGTLIPFRPRTRRDI
ncbi:hypothetical protein ABZ897_60375 [Nonomuraea sp. NPDC046802]|uniref:hypothetical protein n=1 Tax=Nonomuraea sp. NPDC046802 TaxID=3154919 RepID=UPI00340298AA